MSSIADYLCTPAWAIEATALEGIVQTAVSAKGQAKYGHETPPKVVGYYNANGVGVVPISGVIMRRADQVNGFGQPRGTSLEQIHNDMAAAAADASARSVLLAIDSPGGSVDGIIDAAASLRALRAAKPVHAHVSGMAASAGYWLAAQADKVFATAGSKVGSIGVFAPVVDNHRLLESLGIDFKYVSSVQGKVDQPLAGKSLDLNTLRAAESQVKEWHSKFIADVAAGRGIAKDKAAAWGDASMHFAADAQRLGLIDGIASQAETIQALQQSASKRVDLGAKQNGRRMNAQNEGAPQAVAPQVPTSAQELRGAFPDLVQAIERQAAQSALAAEKDRIATIAKACKGKSEAHLRVAIDAAANGMSALDAVIAMLDVVPSAAAPVSTTANQFPARTFATSQVQPLGSTPLPEPAPQQKRGPRPVADAKKEWEALSAAHKGDFHNDFHKFAAATGGTTI